MIMKFLVPFLLAFVLVLPAGGDSPGKAAVLGIVAGQDAVEVEPTFAVDIQDECEVGELVRMSADGSVDGIRWEIKPDSPDFEVIGDGRRAFFSGRTPGEFLIIVAGAKGGQPFLHYQTLTVRGDPTPVSELTGKIYTALKKLPKDVNKAKVKQVAGVFRKMANSDTPVEKMLEATALANSAVIGDDIESWVPFLEDLGTELDSLVEAKKLDTRDQYKSAWLEIAGALERGSK